MSTYIKEVKIFNFAKVRELAVSFAKDITYLAGVNGAGKSTVVNALWAGFMGVVSKGKPGAMIGSRYEIIGEFAKTARTEITLHDLKTGQDILIKTKVSRSGNEISAETIDGEPMPDGYIDNLFNLMCIDPTSFTHLPPSAQAHALGIDTNGFDGKIKDLKAERTDINREVKRLQVVVDNWGEMKEVLPVDTVALIAERDKIVVYNENQDSLDDLLSPESLSVIMRGYDDDPEKTNWMEMEFEIRREKILAWIARLKAPLKHKSTSEIDEKIANADQVNRDANGYQTYLNDVAALESQVKLQAAINEKIDAEVLAREEYIKAQKLPFSNMGIDEDGGLLVGGTPFREPYFSTGEIWSMSAKLLAALNPDLKTIIVRGANNLDDDKRAGVEALSKPVKDDNGNITREAYQIIFEFISKKPVENRHTILLKECEIVKGYDDKPKTADNL